MFRNIHEQHLVRWNSLEQCSNIYNTNIVLKMNSLFSKEKGAKEEGKEKPPMVSMGTLVRR